MTYQNAAAALEGNGYCPRTTPVDTLMAAPVRVGLDVAEAMEDDGNYADGGTAFDIPDGFQEANFAQEQAEGIINRWPGW